MQFTVNKQSTYAYTGTRHSDSTQPAVVFIHGAQNDHTVWALQSRYLAHHGYRVFALDLPGHGRSAGQPLATIDEQADWVLAAMRELNSGPSSLVGHSMGSLIALAAAAKAPAQVARAALVCTAVPMAVSDVLLNAATNDEQQAFEMIANWSHSGVNHRPGAPGPGFSIYMQSIRLMQRQAAGVLLTDFSACNRFENGLQAADQVSCPVLILSGRKDMMTPPRAAQALFDRLAASSKCPPPERKLLDGGHQVMAEQPDAVLNALREFLSRPA